MGFISLCLMLAAVCAGCMDGKVESTVSGAASRIGEDMGSTISRVESALDPDQGSRDPDLGSHDPDLGSRDPDQGSHDPDRDEDFISGSDDGADNDFNSIHPDSSLDGTLSDGNGDLDDESGSSSVKD